MIMLVNVYIKIRINRHKFRPPPQPIHLTFDKSSMLV